MNLTEHFTLEELTTSGRHPEIQNDASALVVENLRKIAAKFEQARAIWGVPVAISYGYRCEKLNQAVGGSSSSAHLLGLAADAIPQGLEFRPAWDMLVAHPTFCEDIDQLIIERGCIHIGLALPRYGDVPRHQLRLDATIGGKRIYPLYGIWTPDGVIKETT